eukprot:scaffold20946_cov64-Phaeocystis_antarctica.AAC.5
MVMPHSLPLRVSFVAGPYIWSLRPVLTYPAWSGAPMVGFNKRQSFKKGLHGWARGQSKTVKLEGGTGNNWLNPCAPVAGRENLPRLRRKL